MAFPTPPEPKTDLGRYRILASTAGVRVSPLALGAMSIGKSWASWMGAMDEEQSFKLLDAYVDAGGNFIDTANNYQDEDSELYLGKWMEARNNRDLMFVATKFTNDFRGWEIGLGKTVNYAGNHKKSLRLSVEASLRKLQTNYIDLLYVHWWDWSTSIEELMDSLHILVEQGKVLYLGVSDTPAWVASAANTYAKAHGKTPFSVYQGRWNIMHRDFERDIIPMARHFGMALCPWDVLGGGQLQTRAQRAARQESDPTGRGSQQSEETLRVSDALEKVAAEHGKASIQQVALAYVMHKAPLVFPLVGGRKVEHLHDNIKALSIRLTDNQVKYIESIKSFDLGFPLDFIGEDPRETGRSTPMMESLLGGKISWKKTSTAMGCI
ncbi:aryl-alcohol dehydrogenase AAD14 [Fusarium flagelliforme]|uniref:Aryl-alcohol dehydrogenase aad14 n=1 Tax=Fusarium flagelliforme TaxID=2675880 RepID=A0A395M7L7_9HYPO|nr:aryl-alcohol dehydrogenase AAD14 [Fusarium flagelliforme]KAH7169660.1 aryl-alcohol dehydrogenase AAD14 [Fusarium flagelliforme]RFN43875.1 aryl-alcohol dehydrogenase aad14 [Fusarium flagelliforme]